VRILNAVRDKCECLRVAASCNQESDVFLRVLVGVLTGRRGICDQFFCTVEIAIGKYYLACFVFGCMDSVHQCVKYAAEEFPQPWWGAVDIRRVLFWRSISALSVYPTTVLMHPLDTLACFYLHECT